MPRDSDRRRALATLPLADAVALRLRDAGADTKLIADALAIEPEGVANLLEIAEAKLRRAQATLTDVRDGRAGGVV